MSRDRWDARVGGRISTLVRSDRLDHAHENGQYGAVSARIVLPSAVVTGPVTRRSRRHVGPNSWARAEYAANEYAGLPVSEEAPLRVSSPSKAEECHQCPLDFDNLLRVSWPTRVWTFDLLTLAAARPPCACAVLNG